MPEHCPIPVSQCIPRGLVSICLNLLGASIRTVPTLKDMWINLCSARQSFPNKACGPTVGGSFTVFINLLFKCTFDSSFKILLAPQISLSQLVKQPECQDPVSAVRFKDWYSSQNFSELEDLMAKAGSSILRSCSVSPEFP